MSENKRTAVLIEGEKIDVLMPGNDAYRNAKVLKAVPVFISHNIMVASDEPLARELPSLK